MFLFRLSFEMEYKCGCVTAVRLSGTLREPFMREHREMCDAKKGIWQRELIAAPITNRLISTWTKEDSGIISLCRRTCYFAGLEKNVKKIKKLESGEATRITSSPLVMACACVPCMVCTLPGCNKTQVRWIPLLQPRSTAAVHGFGTNAAKNT